MRNNILQPIDQVRWRIRIQNSLNLLVHLSLPVVILLCLIALLLRVKGLDFPAVLFLLFPLLAVVTIPLGFLIPVSRLLAARILDKGNQLKDRVSSAYEFLSRPEQTPWMRLQIQDATKHLPAANPKKAYKITLPSHSLALFLSILMFFEVWWLPFHLVPAQKMSAHRLQETIEKDWELQMEKEKVKELADLAEKAEQNEIKKFFDRLNQLIGDIEQKRIDPKQFLKGMESLNQQLGKEAQIPSSEIQAQFQQIVKELKSEKKIFGGLDTPPKGPKERIETKKAFLKKLAALSPAEKNRLQTLLKRLSKQHHPAESKLLQAQRRLIKDLLSKLARKGPEEKQLQKQLVRRQRELEKLLRREKKQNPGKWQLQRLTRRMDQLADILSRNHWTEKERAELEKWASEFSRFQKQVGKFNYMKLSQKQVNDLKEWLRRRGNNPTDRHKKLSEFMVRADGSCDQCEQCQKPSGPKKKTDCQGVCQKCARWLQNQKASGRSLQRYQTRQRSSDWGKTPDNQLFNKKTKMKVQTAVKKVFGKEGQGVVKSQVFRGAAEKGFSIQGYKKLYQDYSGVLEEVMAKEQIPLAYRYYIQKYFLLIRPRD